MSAEEFDALLTQQGGACAICGSSQVARGRRYLSIDHDHETGQVRGILCSNCNTALGMFGDRLELFEKAVSYLKSPPFTAFDRIPVETAAPLTPEQYRQKHNANQLNWHHQGAGAEYQKSYRERNRDMVNAKQREYRARKKAQAALESPA